MIKIHRQTKLICSALVSLLPILCIAQQQSDRERANLLGRVKTISEKQLKYSGDRSKPRDTITYDARGNEIERTMYSDYGELMGVQKQTFGENGRLKESVFTSASGKPEDRRLFVYATDKLVEIQTFSRNRRLIAKEKRSYDDKGRITEEVYYDPSVARAKSVFEYDSSGNLIDVKFFMADGSKAIAPVGPCLGGHRVTFTYDEKRRPITKTVYDDNGNLKKRWTYGYDSHGNYSTYTVQSGSSVTKYSYTYDYDEKGNWIKSTQSSEHQDAMIDRLMNSMLETEGKTATPEERKKAQEEISSRTRSQSVTVREITYY